MGHFRVEIKGQSEPVVVEGVKGETKPLAQELTILIPEQSVGSRSAVVFAPKESPITVVGLKQTVIDAHLPEERARVRSSWSYPKGIFVRSGDCPVQIWIKPTPDRPRKRFGTLKWQE